jgi:hypothetical protein
VPSPSNHPERLSELLCDRVTGGLAPADVRELEVLLAAGRESRRIGGPGKDPETKPGMGLPIGSELDEEAFERVAAAVVLVECGLGDSELPASLARRLEADAVNHLQVRRAARAEQELSGSGVIASREFTPRSGAQSSISAQSDGSIPMPQSGSRSATMGWLAAAAALALAAVGWWPRLAPQPAPLSPGPGPEVQAPTASEARDRLLRDSPGLVVASWVMPAPETPDASCPEGCAGDIVWSNATQRGYMRFTGLARNDPTTSQYQLWIFDSNQPEETPVDGGVFDVSEDGEVIIPIDAKLRIVDPTLFAVTVEKPGGVVRSERKRIPVLAKVEA